FKVLIAHQKVRSTARWFFPRRCRAGTSPEAAAIRDRRTTSRGRGDIYRGSGWGSRRVRPRSRAERYRNGGKGADGLWVPCPVGFEISTGDRWSARPFAS